MYGEEKIHTNFQSQILIGRGNVEVLDIAWIITVKVRFFL
jgi:hypothetical protein